MLVVHRMLRLASVLAIVLVLGCFTGCGERGSETAAPLTSTDMRAQSGVVWGTNGLTLHLQERIPSRESWFDASADGQVKLRVIVAGKPLRGTATVSWDEEGEPVTRTVEFEDGQVQISVPVPFEAQRVAVEAGYLTPDRLPPLGTKERERLLADELARARSVWTEKRGMPRLRVLRLFGQEAAEAADLLREMLADDPTPRLRRQLSQILWEIHAPRGCELEADAVKDRQRFSAARVSSGQQDLARRLGIPVVRFNRIGMPFVLSDLRGSAGGSPVYVLMREVTNEDLARVGRADRSVSFRGRSLVHPQLPACSISYEEAIAFADALSREDGEFSYRLPSWKELDTLSTVNGSRTRWVEARGLTWSECENLADEGSSVFWSQGPGSLVDMFLNEYGDTFRPGSDGSACIACAASYYPSPQGLFDLHGNVMEWCTPVEEKVGEDGKRQADLWGGSWFHGRQHTLESPPRRSGPVDQRSELVGFRLIAEPR